MSRVIWNGTIQESLNYFNDFAGYYFIFTSELAALLCIVTIFHNSQYPKGAIVSHNYYNYGIKNIHLIQDNINFVSHR